MRPWASLVALSLFACEKTNKVQVEGQSSQPVTCLQACQKAYDKGDDAGATAWCGLPVPTGGPKGSDMTACESDCKKKNTPQATLDCVDSSGSCGDINACSFLSP